MRILMLNYEFPPLGGGGGIACYQLAKELAKKHTIDYLTTGFKGLKKYENIEGINIHRVPVLNRQELSTATFSSMVSFFPSSLWKGISLCKKNNYDLINTHFAIPSGPTGIILSKLFKIPHVLTIIGGDIYDPSKRLSPHKNIVLNRIISYIVNKSDKVIAISKDTKERTIKYYEVEKEINIVHYGLELPNFEKHTRSELGLSDDDFILIAVGRLIKRKGLKYLIKAIEKLDDGRIKLLIIGDGPDKENLKALSRELKIDSQVNFLGPIWGDKKFQYLHASDVFVLPSLHEGFGIVFLEAMYCGLPIITTNYGGQRDFIIDTENGFLVPVGNVDALADKIRFLLTNEKVRHKISKNNKRHIKDFYISNMANKYEEIFKRTLEQY